MWIISNYWMRLSRIGILQIKGGCYPQRPKAEMDNNLWDLQNSSYPTKAEFNNWFIIHSKYFAVIKGVCFSAYQKKTQSRPQVFSVNGSIICSGLHFWRHFDVIGSIICSALHIWRHAWVRYLVNSSWLWCILRVVLTNQKQGNTLNE